MIVNRFALPLSGTLGCFKHQVQFDPKVPLWLLPCPHPPRLYTQSADVTSGQIVTGETLHAEESKTGTVLLLLSLNITKYPPL